MNKDVLVAVFDYLSIEGFSREVLMALLAGTPVAMRAQETSIPKTELAALVAGDNETFTDVVSDLMRNKTLRLGERSISFSPLVSFQSSHDGRHFVYQLNATFVQLIEAAYANPDLFD